MFVQPLKIGKKPANVLFLNSASPAWRLMACHLARGRPVVGKMGGSGRIRRGGPNLFFFYRAHACHPSPEKVINPPGVEKPQNELNGIQCAPRERTLLSNSLHLAAGCGGLRELERRFLNE